jgi:hypothetical protein
MRTLFQPLQFCSIFISYAGVRSRNAQTNLLPKDVVRLVRGATNFASVAELPKQTSLTGRNHGAVGYV